MHPWSPRRTREEKGVKGIFKEIMADIFLNLEEIWISKFIKLLANMSLHNFNPK